MGLLSGVDRQETLDDVTPHYDVGPFVAVGVQVRYMLNNRKIYLSR